MGAITASSLLQGLKENYLDSTNRISGGEKRIWLNKIDEDESLNRTQKSDFKSLVRDIAQAAEYGAIDGDEAQEIVNTYAKHGVTLEQLTGWGDTWINNFAGRIAWTGSDATAAFFDSSYTNNKDDRLEIITQVMQLTGIPSDEAITELSDAMADEDDEIGYKAADALAFLAKNKGITDAEGKLWDGLESGNVLTQQRSASGVVRLDSVAIRAKHDDIVAMIESDDSDKLTNIHLSEALYEQSDEDSETFSDDMAVIRRSISLAGINHDDVKLSRAAMDLAQEVAFYNPEVFTGEEHILTHMMHDSKDPQTLKKAATALYNVGNSESYMRLYMLADTEMWGEAGPMQEAAFEQLEDLEIGDNIPDQSNLRYLTLKNLAENIREGDPAFVKDSAVAMAGFEYLNRGGIEDTVVALTQVVYNPGNLKNEDSELRYLQAMQAMAVIADKYEYEDGFAVSNEAMASCLVGESKSGSYYSHHAMSALGGFPKQKDATMELARVLVESRDERDVRVAIYALTNQLKSSQFPKGSWIHRHVSRVARGLTVRIANGDFSEQETKHMAKALEELQPYLV
jgi:hypothetical protein